MSKKIAKGVIEFQYNLDDEIFEDENMSEEEKVQYFLDKMVDDIIDLRYSDIKPAIEMTIVEGK